VWSRPPQVERLLALGCRLAQGYHFAGPLEPEALAERLGRAARPSALLT
jgi:EAL domain-containing protein (putative c-di-GMP-specific phosphodiesterase class I)